MQLTSGDEECSGTSRPYRSEQTSDGQLGLPATPATLTASGRASSTCDSRGRALLYLADPPFPLGFAEASPRQIAERPQRSFRRAEFFVENRLQRARIGGPPSVTSHLSIAPLSFSARPLDESLGQRSGSSSANCPCGQCRTARTALDDDRLPFLQCFLTCFHHSCCIARQANKPVSIPFRVTAPLSGTLRGSGKAMCSVTDVQDRTTSVGSARDGAK